METEAAEEVTQRAVQSVQNFFNQHIDDSHAVFPDVLGNSGVWMAICADQVLGIFFLSEAEQARVNACRQQGVHPFPGFVIGENERPSEQRAAYNVTTPFRFYSEKSSQDTFAFSLSGEGSCVVVDHRHEIADRSGKKVTYGVDLAFLLGHDAAEPWTEFELRLSSLLDYTLEVWKPS